MLREMTMETPLATMMMVTPLPHTDLVEDTGDVVDHPPQDQGDKDCSPPDHGECPVVWMVAIVEGATVAALTPALSHQVNTPLA